MDSDMEKICKNCIHWKPLYDGSKVDGCELCHDVIRTTDYCDYDFKEKEL